VALKNQSLHHGLTKRILDILYPIAPDEAERAPPRSVSVTWLPDGALRPDFAKF